MNAPFSSPSPDSQIKSPLSIMTSLQAELGGMTIDLLLKTQAWIFDVLSQSIEGIKSLQDQLNAYAVEENLTSSNPLFASFNVLNPYHGFLEGQKTRKLFFEAALVQIKIFKATFPHLSSRVQQMENFIKTNLAFTFTFNRPDWNLDFEHSIVESLDFADVVKFPASKEKNNGRNILLAAPMSGHFATLLRKTIESLHNDGYTVFITDWKSPFDVSRQKGKFTVDRYTQEILNTYEVVQKDVGQFDVLAICQPSPETMTATAYAEENNLPKPRSISLMAGPIDVSKSPTGVNQASEKLTPEILDAFKLIVPDGKYKGAGREVYPAPLQIISFISTKPKEHMEKYMSLAYKTTPLTVEEEKVLAFYTEYFAVMDLPHEFYKETVNRVFRSNEWASGKVSFQGKIIDFSKMKTPLATIEGEKDDICGLGQTEAAHRIAPNTEKHTHISVEGAGHYGVFAGKPFREVVLRQLDAFYASLSQ